MAQERGNMVAIKEQIQTGSYTVDSHLVADAIIRRMGGVMGVSLVAGTQNSCSKPRSASSASTNETAGSPSTTDPIQVSPSFAPKHC